MARCVGGGGGGGGGWVRKGEQRQTQEQWGHKGDVRADGTAAATHCGAGWRGIHAVAATSL